MKYLKIYLLIIFSFFILWVFFRATAIYWLPVPGRGVVLPTPDTYTKFWMNVLLPLTVIKFALLLPAFKLLGFLASFLGIKADSYMSLISVLSYLLTGGWITLLIYLKDQFYKKIDDEVESRVRNKGRDLTSR